MQVTQEELNKMGAELLRDKRALHEMTAEFLQDKAAMDEITIGIATAAEGMTQLRAALNSIVTQTMSAAERIKKDVEIERQQHELRCAELRRQLEKSLEDAKAARLDIAHKQAEITEIHKEASAVQEQAKETTQKLDEWEKAVYARERACEQAEAEIQGRNDALDKSIEEAQQAKRLLNARLAALATV